MSPIQDALHQLMIANRIVAHEGVCDAFGHVSLRHPDNPEQFLLSFSKSPELVETSDLAAYDMTGELVEPSARKPYLERYIHAGIYAARPEVMAVVHNHSYDVIPFAVTPEKLRPLTHTGAIMGAEIPVWDIAERFGDTNMLVVNMEQAADLAACLGSNTAALMRGHGCVVAGTSLKRAVASAIYMQINARLQLAARSLGDPVFLSPEEARLAAELNLGDLVMARLWDYWARRAGC